MSVRVPDGNGPLGLKLVCLLRNSAAEAAYRLGTEVVTAPAGERILEFHLGPQAPGPHTWSLTELNGVTWVFTRCDIYRDS
jgi:hypothetical protein